MPRFIAVCFLLLLAPGVQSPVAHATPTALVMNGIDNTISTADLTTGAVQLGPHAFAGFPSEAVVKAGKLYVVVSGADAVEVLDTATLTLLQTLSTGAGSNPYALDVDDAGNVYVSLLNTHELVRFDATGTETGRVGVGGSPEDVLLLNGVCYVANTGFRPSDFGYDPGTVFALDPGTLAITDTLAVGMNPQWLAAWNNDLHVMCTGNYFSVFGEAHVIDGATHAPQDTLVLGGSPGKIAIGDGLAVTTDYFGGLYTYDADTRTVIRDSGNALLVGGTGYTGLAFDGMGNLLFTLFADDLLVRLRLSDEQVIDTYATGDGPGCLAVHEDKPVPVQLTTFSVEATEAGVRLDWTLGDVHEASRIQVERSGGAADWRTVADLVAAERGTWRDEDPVRGEVAYRLVARLRTGGLETLGERRITVAALPLAARALDNPSRGALRLALRGIQGKATVRLVDVRGRVLLSRDGVADGALALDTTPFANGIYFVHLTDGSHTAVTRVAVVR